MVNLIKSLIFTTTPCKSTCLYNAPSMHTVKRSKFTTQRTAIPAAIYRNAGGPGLKVPGPVLFEQFWAPPWPSFPWCLGKNQGKPPKTPRIFLTPLNPRKTEKKTVEKQPKHQGTSLVRKGQGKSKHQGKEDQGCLGVLQRVLLECFSAFFGPKKRRKTLKKHSLGHSEAGAQNFRAAKPAEVCLWNFGWNLIWNSTWDLKFPMGKICWNFGGGLFYLPGKHEKFRGEFRSKFRRNFRKLRFKFRDFFRKLRSAEGQVLTKLLKKHSAWSKGGSRLKIESKSTQKRAKKKTTRDWLPGRWVRGE